MPWFWWSLVKHPPVTAGYGVAYGFGLTQSGIYVLRRYCHYPPLITPTGTKSKQNMKTYPTSK